MEYKCFLDGVNRKEEQAWVELYDYFYAPLCCYSTKIIGDAQVAEDIVQNILIKLWHSNLHFNEIKVITAYLYHSVYNTSLNYIRDKQRAKKIHESWIAEIQESDGVEMALEEEAITRFYQVISHLPEQQKQILLRSMKGERVKEIADKMNISENTVKTQKKRAYAFVREQLDDLWVVVISMLFV